MDVTADPVLTHCTDSIWHRLNIEKLAGAYYQRLVWLRFGYDVLVRALKLLELEVNFVILPWPFLTVFNLSICPTANYQSESVPWTPFSSVRILNPNNHHRLSPFGPIPDWLTTLPNLAPSTANLIHLTNSPNAETYFQSNPHYEGYQQKFRGWILDEWTSGVKTAQSNPGAPIQLLAVATSSVISLQPCLHLRYISHLKSQESTISVGTKSWHALTCHHKHNPEETDHSALECATRPSLRWFIMRHLVVNIRLTYILRVASPLCAMVYHVHDPLGLKRSTCAWREEGVLNDAELSQSCNHPRSKEIQRTHPLHLFGIEVHSQRPGTM